MDYRNNRLTLDFELDPTVQQVASVMPLDIVPTEAKTIPCHGDSHQELADMNLWHDRTHITGDRLKDLQAITTGLVIRQSRLCKGCNDGSQLSVQHRRSKNAKAEEVGHKIYLDVFGPTSTVSLNQSKYFLLIKDEHSSYLFVHFMKSTKQVSEGLREFIKKYHIRNRVCRSDNALSV